MREASWGGPALAVALACWATPAAADNLVSGAPANTFELTSYVTGLRRARRGLARR